MTGIRFDFNVADRVDYACRLLRKAWRANSPVAVTGEESTLTAIDVALWRIGAADFVPHAWASRADAVPEALHASTVWLATDPDSAPGHGTLVNVGAHTPRGFESFERLIELVTTDEADRQAARDRWRAYARRGYAIERHEVAGA